MESILTPSGKFLSNKDDIIEVVGPYEIECKHYQPVSKFGLTIRCTNHEYILGYDTEKAAQRDAVFIDSL